MNRCGRRTCGRLASKRMRLGSCLSKLRVGFVLVLVLSMMLSMTVSAAGSINPGTNKPAVVDDKGKRTGGGSGDAGRATGVISTDVDTSTYQNIETIALVEMVNAGDDTPISEYIEFLPEVEGKTDAENFPTTVGYDVNLKLYDRITDFYEIRNLKNGDVINEAPGEVRILVPETRGMVGSDLMILIIDSKTGEMYAVPPTMFDSDTGIITVDLPCVGPYCVVHKLPIVVRNVDPDRYPNKELAEIIKNMSSTDIIDCLDFLRDTGADPYDTLEVAEGVTVKTEDYSSAIALSDVAVMIDIDNFNYDLSTKFKANLYRGNDKVDWERILKYSEVDYEKEAILADDRELTELEPITLEDCFVYHIDAATRDVSIIYEPTICWETYGNLEEDKEYQLTQEDIQYFQVDDIDEQNVEETQLQLDQEKTKKVKEDETSLLDLFTATAYAAENDTDENENNIAHDEDDVCLVINGDQYLGMGPFLLFMPKEEGIFGGSGSGSGFPWWILILIAIIIIALIIFFVKRNKKEEER